MKRAKIVLLALFVLALVLTVGLRGVVNPQTIRVVDAKSSSTSYVESDAASTIGYQENFTGWYLGYQSQNVSSDITSTSGGLTIKGNFQPSKESSSAAVFKQVSLDLASFPILDVHLNVSSGVNYGLRFFSKYTNGTTYNVWWEGSPLDHRPGAGAEGIRANLEYQAILATGRTVDALNYLEVYVEAAPNTARSFALSIDRYEFMSDALTPLPSEGEFRVTYEDFGTPAQFGESWYLDKVHFGVTITATAGTVLQMFFIQGLRVYSSLSPSLYVYSPLNQYYEFTFYPSVLQKTFPELLPPSGSSVVLLAKTGFIKSLSIHSLDLIFLLNVEQGSTIPPETFAAYYSYLITFLFSVPVAVALLTFWRFFRLESVGRAPIVAVGMVGLLCRIAIIPIAAHRFDLDVSLASARSWFQYGSPSGSIGPTLPLTFLLYWIPYSFYALLQIFGFHDVFLPTHQDGVLEGVFIRMFPLAADALVFLVLTRLKAGGKGLVWATFYLLNPLAIYISAVWGQYDGASVALIGLGVYWLVRGRTGRAGITFVLSGMLQLLGFIPYAFTLLRTAMQKKYYSLLGLLGALTLVLVYRPETLLLYLLVLAALGLTKTLTLSGPGLYTLIGNLPSLSFVATLHPLLLSMGAIGITATFYTAKGKMTPASTILFTGLASVALVLFSSLLAGWIWLLALPLFYASLKGKDGLGVFSLVFGTSTAFLMMSYTVGSRYLLTGDPNYKVVPLVESLNRGVQIFAISATLLTLIMLLLMWRGKGDANKTLVLTSGFTVALNLILLLGLGGLAI
jgi:hypothetical protein